MHVPRNILVATDLSDASLAAVDAAAGMVGALGAQVALVCAFDPMQSLPMVDTAMGATDIWTSELDELEDRIERALEKVRDERFAGTGCDVVVIRDGSPGRAIADEAERLGAHAHPAPGYRFADGDLLVPDVHHPGSALLVDARRRDPASHGLRAHPTRRPQRRHGRDTLPVPGRREGSPSAGLGARLHAG
mgnify:CR=1 FL=1